MSVITLMRDDQAPPNDKDHSILAHFLTGVIDGFSQDDKSAWRRFLRRLWKMEPGELAVIEARIPRNPKFHRKFFALLQVGFDAWDPGRKRKTYKGREVSKNFEQFREDVTILAGYYDQTFDLRGRMKVKAKSISFARMDDPEFEQLYSAVADVLLGHVLTKYADRSELDAVVERVLGFV